MLREPYRDSVTVSHDSRYIWLAASIFCNPGGSVESFKVADQRHLQTSYHLLDGCKYKLRRSAACLTFTTPCFRQCRNTTTRNHGFLFPDPEKTKHVLQTIYQAPDVCEYPDTPICIMKCHLQLLGAVQSPRTHSYRREVL
jgi:hypothetical protein